MKKISTISRIVGACILIIGALLLGFKVSDWILATVAVVAAVCVFLSVYLSRKDKPCKSKQ